MLPTRLVWYLLVTLTLLVCSLLLDKNNQHATLALTDVLDSSEELFPNSFSWPDREISNYTIRYLSTGGVDRPDCLLNQPYPLIQSNSSSIVSECGTLRYALTGGHEYNTSDMNNIIVLIQPGEYTYGNMSIVMHNFRNIVIKKVPNVKGEVILYCKEKLENGFNNLYVTVSSYIFIEGVVFEQCGPLTPGLSIRKVNHLVVSNCISRNNLHSGILTYQSNDMLFMDCTFENNNSTAPYNESNNLDPEQLRFAGGLSMSWQNDTVEQTSVMVKNCTFVRNSARLSQSNINDTRPNTYIPQGHGGAIVSHFDNTRNHTLFIEDTVITNNTALHSGGGAFFSFYRESTGNKIVIRNTVFEMNSCNSAGGGINMNTFETANYNTLVVENSTFTGNVAKVGGGAFSLDIQDQLVAEGTMNIGNVASFDNCTFDGNTSPRGGSAIGLLSNARVDQALVPITFTDCSFFNNQAEEDSTIMSFRFPISFNGTNILQGNNGGGVLLLQSRMNVGGNLWFENNTANVGGAIAFQDQSLLHLLREANITFIANHANERGGAMSVISPSVGLDTDVIRLFNTRCFIQYDVNNTPGSAGPSEWNATISFIDNTARIDGAAIYATDIEQCLYVPGIDTSGASNIFERSIFQTRVFLFSGNHVLNATVNRTTEHFATAPSQLFVSPQNISGAPGEFIEFNVTAVDQSGNWQQAVWSLQDESAELNLQGPNSMDDENQRFFVVPASGNKHRYRMKNLNPDSYQNCSNDSLKTRFDFSLIQIVAGEANNETMVNVSISCCHPGYYFNNETGLCDHDHSSTVIVRPDVNRHYVFIEPDLYAEVREDDEQLVTAILPQPFQNCTPQGTLRGCLFKYDQLDEQCFGGRTGFMCGSCPVNTSLDLTLRTCKECTAGDAVIVAVIVTAFVIASFLVLVFNIGVPNDLKGCFFFVQVVGFIYPSQSVQGIPWDFHLSRFFGFSFYLPVCPYPGYSALVTASYGLILSAFAVLTITVYIIGAKFFRILSDRSSFEGIWLLCIITYKYTADTSFNLLRCQKVTGENVHGEFRYYYDGTIECFSSNSHLGFAIVALIIGVLVLLFPILIFVISFRRFKHTQAFTDVLTNGIEISRRWWSGFDLLRRLLFVIVVFLFNYVQPAYSQLALFFLGLVIFFIFACAQPYKEQRTNIIETLVLLDLLILTALFLKTDSRSREAVDDLGALLLLLPFFIAIGYIALKIMSTIWKKTSPTSFMNFCMRVRNLLTKTLWPGDEAKGGITHNLDLYVEVDEHGNETLVGTEMEGSGVHGDYSAYREELLEENGH